MTSAEIMDALGVSAAAVSTSTSYLHQVGLARRLRETGSRKVVHALVSDDWYSSLMDRRPVYDALETLCADGVAAVGGAGTPAGQRLWLTQEMAAFMRVEMVDMARRWQDRRAELIATLG